MPFIVGVDPSAKKIALVSNHPVLNVSSAHTYSLYKKGATRQTPESLAVALTGMENFLQWAEQVAPDGTRRCAWVENPLVGRGGTATTMKQAFVGGIIRAALFRAGFEVYEVNVQTWKKQVCGNGHADKAVVAQTVKQKDPKMYSLVKDDGDLVDAAAIALYGAGVVNRAAAVAGTASRPDGWTMS